MDLHDFINVRNVFRMIAAEWGCPVWMVKSIIRRTINRCWAQAMQDPEAKVLRNKFFPKGKPTPKQYVLMLGYAHETGDVIPDLLKY